jgi:hypothetical protein
MAFWRKKDKKPVKSGPPAKSEPPLDRRKMLGQIRKDLLAKMGLPPDTSPEKFQAIIQQAARKSDARKKALRDAREQILQSLRLPPGVPPDHVMKWLELRNTLDKLNKINEQTDKK